MRSISKLFLIFVLVQNISVFAIETYEECIQQLKNLHEHSEYLADIKVYIIDNCEKFTSDERETLKSVIKAQRDKLRDANLHKLFIASGVGFFTGILTIGIACYTVKNPDQLPAESLLMFGFFTGFIGFLMPSIMRVAHIENLLESF